MAERSREDKHCRATHECDLRDAGRYADAVEWVRSNVVLSNTVGRDVLELNVMLPRGSVTLYMAPATHYIMGFRGSDRVYLLNDDQSPSFTRALEAELQTVPVKTLDRVDSSHGQNGLGTLAHTAKGVESREFSRKDLDAAKELSNFSSATKFVSIETLKHSLSLLVCMLCESARIPMMEYEFIYRFYQGQTIRASEAVQSYSRAKYITTTAMTIFPGDYRRHAIERLGIRANLLLLILERLAPLMRAANQAKLIETVMRGPLPLMPAASYPVKQFREMCAELGLKNASDVNLMLRHFSKEGALHTAMIGVVIPDIGVTKL